MVFVPFARPLQTTAPAAYLCAAAFRAFGAAAEAAPLFGHHFNFIQKGEVLTDPNPNLNEPGGRADGSPATSVQKPSADAAGPAPSPDKHTAQQSAQARKGLANLRNLMNRHTVEQVLVGLQRGANEAAVQEIRTSTGKMPLRPVVNALGQLLYRIGTQAEYFLLTFGRVLVRIGWGLRSLAGGILQATGVPLARFFTIMARDLSAPWRRFVSGVRNMYAAIQAERERGGQAGKTGIAYFTQGVRTYRHLITSALNWLLPVGAVGLFALTVNLMLSNGFSLQVEYQGNILGFVESQTVWDDATGIVRGRIVAAGENEQWEPQARFTILPVSTAARSSANQLADDIIASSGDQIQNATGLYAGSTLLGVAPDGQALQEYLNSLLEPYQQPDNPNHQVSFAQGLQLVPGVYFTSSVTDTNTVLNTLNADPAYLQVQTTDLVEYDEEIPFEEVEQESDAYYEGVRRVIQSGVPGSQHVVALVTSINGAEVSRQIQSATVLAEAVPQIVAVGTRERYNNFPAYSEQVGTGTWTFPVPGYTGFSTYSGHRGYDFQAPYGSPIYACEAGTVVYATYHSSWGNYVLIRHPSGLYSLYGHCSQLYVAAGQTVDRGQLIGAVGATGYASGNHLHLEVWTDGSGSRSSLANPLDFVTPP